VSDQTDHVEVLSRLRALASERVGIDPERFQPDLELNQVGIDSFSFVELVFAIEEEFKVRLPLDIGGMRTVNDVVETLCARLKSQPA